VATAEKSKRHLISDESRYADDGEEHEVLSDSDIESDDDGVPIPKQSGPVPRALDPDAFSRSSRGPRDSRGLLPEASLPREGGLIAGKYRVDGVHDRDSMVVTLKASHVELGTRVWVRYLLPRAVRRPDSMARFLKGARAVAKMRSEHAARVLDVGKIRSSIPFVVMDDMNGWDLDEVLRVRGPLPVQEAVEYVLQAAEAVAEAHGLGIVHGSLRPTNVLLARQEDDSPHVKVVGFELAEVLDWTLPQDSLESGTPAAWFATTLPYLAPEQIRSADHIDERADVWAVGAILHSLLTGGPPFRGRTAAALLAAVSADEPRHVGEVRGDVAPDLEELILRCLSKNPSERPASMSELASALTPFAPGDGLYVIDRINRMPSSVRPPPLPSSPPSRAIVPVPRPRKPAPAKTPPPTMPTQWLLLTAVVGLFASVFGALLVVVIVRGNGGPDREDRAPSAALQMPSPPREPVREALAAPVQAAPEAPLTPAPRAAENAARAPAQMEAAPRAPARPKQREQSPARADQRVSRAPTAEAPASDRQQAPKDPFGDTR
jgi:serine/threonine-protein kinase